MFGLCINIASFAWVLCYTWRPGDIIESWKAGGVDFHVFGETVRLIFRILAMCFIGLGLTGYATYLSTGKLPWQFFTRLPAMPKISPPSLPKLGDILPELKPAGQDKVYKWRDAQGEWHYTTAFPGEGVEVEVLLIDRNSNVVPGLEANMHTPAVPEEGSIGQALDKARNVQQKLNNRATGRQKVLDNL